MRLSGREQAHHPHQVVGAADQVARHLGFVQADIASPSESTSRFQPAKYLLNSLTDSLADDIAGMPRCSAVDRTPPPTGVLRDVRPDLSLAKVSYAGRGVIALVRSQRAWTKSTLACLIDQLGYRIAFSRPGGLSDLKVDQQPVVVFHERVAGVRQAGLFAFALLGQQCFGISRALMGGIRALLTMEVHPAIAGRATIGPLTGWLVFGAEALEAGRGFDQRAVHGEVFVAQQAQPVGLAHDLIKELAGDIMLEQPLTVLGKHRRIEARFHQRHIQKPTVEQMEIELLAEGARCGPSTD